MYDLNKINKEASEINWEKNRFILFFLDFFFNFCDLTKLIIRVLIILIKIKKKESETIGFVKKN